LPADITEDDILSFFKESAQFIVSVILYYRWSGNFAKIVFKTSSDADAAIKRYHASYWETFDIGVALKPWRENDTTESQKKQDQAETTVQDNGNKPKKSIDNPSYEKRKKNLTNPSEPVRKSLHQQSEVQTHRLKRHQVEQSRYSSNQSLNSDSSERWYPEVYTIKLSGLKCNIKKKKIENLVNPFGSLARHVKILCYPENGICYAYVDYCQKSSAKQAVLKLDKSEFNGAKIHVCHKGKLGFDHNCRHEVETLNNPNNLAYGVNEPSVSTSNLTTTSSDDPKVVQHGSDRTVDKTSTIEVANLNPGTAGTHTHAVECVGKLGDPIYCRNETEMINLKKDELRLSSYSSHESIISDFDERQSFDCCVKISGFRLNIKEWEIECLVRPFGNLTGPVKIMQYPESVISYAYVNYSQKNSAEKAILSLNSKEFDGTKIHACYGYETEIHHDCCSELNALNAPVLDEASVDYSLLDILKTKSIEFKNNLAVISKLPSEHTIRSVIVASCDQGLTEQQHEGSFTVLKITNLHPDTWFQDLEDHFKSYGTSVSMCFHHYTNSSSVIVFYASAKTAMGVMKRFNGSEFNGYKMHIVKANRKMESVVSKISGTAAGKEAPIDEVQYPDTSVMDEAKKEDDTNCQLKSTTE